MKILIVFIGICIININILIYQSDLNRYNNAQEDIKNLADEAAASAALYYNEVDYSMGYLVSNKEEALKHIEFLINSYLNEKKNIKLLNIDYYIYFFDQSNKIFAYKNAELQYVKEFEGPFNFIDEKGNKILIEEPSIIINFDAYFDDIFRLPYIAKKSISRSSMYIIKTRGKNF
jgi:hypothetical protein